MKKKILFLCTGNSCRSQMAEGLFRHDFGESFEVFSAGTKPSFVHPLAIRAMSELDIDISTQTSKHVDTLLEQNIDIVVTVCDNAKEACPTFPSPTTRIPWSFFDPAEATGSEEEQMPIFREVRDQIRNQLREHFSESL